MLTNLEISKRLKQWLTIHSSRFDSDNSLMDLQPAPVPEAAADSGIVEAAMCTERTTPVISLTWPWLWHPILYSIILQGTQTPLLKWALYMTLIPDADVKSRLFTRTKCSQARKLALFLFLLGKLWTWCPERLEFVQPAQFTMMINSMLYAN